MLRPFGRSCRNRGRSSGRSKRTVAKRDVPEKETFQRKQKLELLRCKVLPALPYDHVSFVIAERSQGQEVEVSNLYFLIGCHVVRRYDGNTNSASDILVAADLGAAVLVIVIQKTEAPSYIFRIDAYCVFYDIDCVSGKKNGMPFFCRISIEQYFN